ncbi:hypothetical protein DFS34DRAFT_79934 [Phlyctochytrium arcticum]|nr:hypothetical protein DFS34DRAFT_79934 [Phlyctochytrium arcticum]
MLIYFLCLYLCNLLEIHSFPYCSARRGHTCSGIPPTIKTGPGVLDIGFERNRRFSVFLDGCPYRYISTTWENLQEDNGLQILTREHSSQARLRVKLKDDTYSSLQSH